MSTSRLESFSDAVMAVAITLLVLNIAVPPADAGRVLARDLGRQWPIYAAYVTSFATIGIIWINHHAVIGRLDQVDHAILVHNLLLLPCISLIPFATHVLASFLKQPGDRVPRPTPAPSWSQPSSSGPSTGKLSAANPTCLPPNSSPRDGERSTRAD